MKKNKKKSQISNEFIVLNAVLVLFLLLVLSFIADDFKNISYYKESKAMKDLGYTIQNEFLMTQNVNDGYHRTFIVPSVQENFDFSIANIDTDLIIISSNKNIEQSFLIPNVTGNIKKGENIFNKVGGVVYLNQ